MIVLPFNGERLDSCQEYGMFPSFSEQCHMTLKDLHVIEQCKNSNYAETSNYTNPKDLGAVHSTKNSFVGSFANGSQQKQQHTFYCQNIDLNYICNLTKKPARLVSRTQAVAVQNVLFRQQQAG